MDNNTISFLSLLIETGVTQINLSCNSYGQFLDLVLCKSANLNKVAHTRNTDNRDTFNRHYPPLTITISSTFSQIQMDLKEES